MNKKEKHFIKHPTYPKGQKAMDTFIYSALQYPKVANENGIEGVVIVEFDINHLGKVVATRILKSLHPECDAEAARVVSLLEFQVDRTRGLHVVFHKKLNIRFLKSMFAVKEQQLAPKPETIEVPLSYQYSITLVPSNVGAQTAPDKPLQLQPILIPYRFNWHIFPLKIIYFRSINSLFLLK